MLDHQAAPVTMRYRLAHAARLDPSSLRKAGGLEIVLCMVHDMVCGGDTPARFGALHQAQLHPRLHPAMPQHPEVEARAANRLHAHTALSTPP